MHDFLHSIELDALPGQLASYGVRLLTALLILLVGLWLAARVANFGRRALTRAKVDATLVDFLRNVFYGVLVAVVIVAALDRAGIPSASFLAMLGAAGLAIGLALQGSLSNLAWGVLLIVLRPFRAGDFIETCGVAGSVERVGLMQTHLVMADNREAILPNAKVGGDAILNYNRRGTRRFEVKVGIAYDADIGRAMAAIRELLAADKRILASPVPGVWLDGLGDSSVNLVIRGWTRAAELANTQSDFIRALKERLDAEGIGIPFPQREVRLLQGDAK
jgi:small conductance mechanosensitive channel